MSTKWTLVLLWFTVIGGFCIYCFLCTIFSVLARAWYVQRKGRVFINSRINFSTIVGYGFLIAWISWLIIFSFQLLFQNIISAGMFIGFVIAIAITVGFLLPLSSIEYIYELLPKWYMGPDIPNVTVAFKNERMNKIVEYFIGVAGLAAGVLLIATLIYVFRNK